MHICMYASMHNVCMYASRNSCILAFRVTYRSKPKYNGLDSSINDAKLFINSETIFVMTLVIYVVKRSGYYDLITVNILYLERK